MKQKIEGGWEQIEEVIRRNVSYDEAELGCKWGLDDLIYFLKLEFARVERETKCRYCGYSEEQIKAMEGTFYETREVKSEFIKNLLASERQRCVDEGREQILKLADGITFESGLGKLVNVREELLAFERLLEQLK